MTNVTNSILALPSTGADLSLASQVPSGACSNEEALMQSLEAKKGEPRDVTLCTTEVFKALVDEEQ